MDCKTDKIKFGLKIEYEIYEEVFEYEKNIEAYERKFWLEEYWENISCDKISESESNSIKIEDSINKESLKIEIWDWDMSNI